ncbi:MAG: nucleoside triphosphate pyrophosphohydrolase [Candidatus Euphemobacter frigidus]|nr:nucleoside triphosphate pyrophosphohydrolase [Candidatus Euphemobacter frigidus]MDP8276279.1 nucleoside triphosphate pyrophosphohydrolase [Candidatus Euphemobacter frigidus]
MEKLVRDKIPEIVSAARGERAPFRIASRTEYLRLLGDKLKEEVAEFLERREPGELADILEVVNQLGREVGLTPADLEKMRREKAAIRGGFDRRIVMDF